MSLILTSSRNPSTRVRQALKEFSRLFPKNTVKIVSRGKQSLGDLFSKYQKYNAICIVTVRYGNPDSIVSYLKINEKFVWYLELKLERILLHFELKTEEVDHPYSSQIYFVDMNNDLKLKLTRFFNTVLNMKNDPNLGNNLIKDHDLEIIFSYKNPGFSISAKLLKNKKKIKIGPKIDINEIIINDDDFTT